MCFVFPPWRHLNYKWRVAFTWPSVVFCKKFPVFIAAVMERMVCWIYRELIEAQSREGLVQPTTLVIFLVTQSYSIDGVLTAPNAAKLMSKVLLYMINSQSQFFMLYCIFVSLVIRIKIRSVIGCYGAVLCRVLRVSEVTVSEGCFHIEVR